MRPNCRAPDKGLVLRPAAADDVEFVRDCTACGFELPAEAVDQDDWEERARQTLVIESAGTRVGVMRVDRDEVHDAGIYGFVVVPELQGRGYGRGALSTITRGAHRGCRVRASRSARRQPCSPAPV